MFSYERALSMLQQKLQSSHNQYDVLFKDEAGNWLIKQSLANAIIQHGVLAFNMARLQFPHWTPNLQKTRWPVGVDLRSIQLINADLRQSNLSCSQLNNSCLISAKLRQCNLHNAILQYVDGRGVDLRSANLCGCFIQHSKMDGALLKFANLYSVDFSNTNLRRADLSGAYIKRNGLQWTAQYGVTLSSDEDCQVAISIPPIIFRNSNLEGANLSFLDLSGADMRHCNLRYACMQSVKLFHTDLRGARLRGANFNGATLDDVIIDKGVNLFNRKQ